MPTATSRIVEILESQPEPNLALKGLLVMRFDPERGVLSERIVAAFETIFEALRGSPRWAYGFWPKPAGGTTRVAQPRDVSGAAGQKWVLGSLRSLRSDSGACLALQDGPKPWGAGSSAVHWVPERYGIHLDVSEEWQPGATLLVAMPLDELHQERSLALADALFDSLQATVGWMSPGLWGAPRSLQHSVVNELEPEVLEQLVAVAPQLDLPIVYFGNTEVSPHDFEPDQVVAPHWRVWLGNKSLRRLETKGLEVETLARGARLTVEKSPPLEMTAARYLRYRRFAEQLRAADLMAQSDEASVTSSLLLERFTAATLKAAGGRAASFREAERVGRERVTQIERLTRSEPAEAVRLAELHLDRSEEMLSAGLGAVRRAGQGKLLAPEAMSAWLDRAARRSSLNIYATLDALAIAVLVNDTAQIRAFAKRAAQMAREYVPYREDLKSDPVVKQLKADPTFKKVFG